MSATIKDELLIKLQKSRADLLANLDGRGEYDLRRPLTPTGSIPACRGGRRPRPTLGVLLVRMVAETAQHAGHADIVRELIDGRVGSVDDQLGDDPAFWTALTGRIRTTAERFRSS